MKPANRSDVTWFRYLLFAGWAGLPFGVPINSAYAAKATAVNADCGRQLQHGWSEGLMTHRAGGRSELHVMMYTYSKAGAERIDKQFRARPELMKNVAGLGTGPGGIVIFGINPVQPWLNAPADWFDEICAIASEGGSDFVELGLYSSNNSKSPDFTIRATTGFRNQRGFWIGFEPPSLVPAAPNSKNAQPH